MTLTPRALTALGVVLLISLAFNFFVAGLMVSRTFDRPWRVVGAEPTRERVMLRGMSAVSPDGMLALREAMKAREDGLRDATQQLREARQVVRDRLAAEPFDRAALAEAQAQVNAALDALQTVMSEAVSEAAAGLSPDDRAALARLPLRAPFTMSGPGPDVHINRRSFGRPPPSGNTDFGPGPRLREKGLREEGE